MAVSLYCGGNKKENTLCFDATLGLNVNNLLSCLTAPGQWRFTLPCIFLRACWDGVGFNFYILKH